MSALGLDDRIGTSKNGFLLIVKTSGYTVADIARVLYSDLPAATTVTAEGEPPTEMSPPPTPARETARVYSPAIVTTTPLPGTVI